MKKEFQEKVNDLKNQVIEKLSNTDLTGKLIFVRDEISNFTGYCIDHEIGGICTKLMITNHNNNTITLEDDFGDDLGEFELDIFGLELLIELLD